MLVSAIAGKVAQRDDGGKWACLRDPGYQVGEVGGVVLRGR